MASHFLHQRSDFQDLLAILGQEKGIQFQLIEKDYWIMHVLFGLKLQGFEFELKGGTSLSKGYQIIHRFSEDIDIRIKPPAHLHVNENPKSDKANAVKSRREFYDWLSENIEIEGIVSVERDRNFDDIEGYRSGGIRLHYEPKNGLIEGLKEGILLEVGFDTVTPNRELMISSWAYEKASENPKIKILDNRASGIRCYHPGYTFVEKLHTIVTKYRQEIENGLPKPNLMRQYYDVYCLLDVPEVLGFIGTEEYLAHKNARFPKRDLEIPISKNDAFSLSDRAQRVEFELRYKSTSALYYESQPAFENLLARIGLFLDDL